MSPVCAHIQEDKGAGKSSHDYLALLGHCCCWLSLYQRHVVRKLCLREGEQCRVKEACYECNVRQGNAIWDEAFVTFCYDFFSVLVWGLWIGRFDCY